MKTKIQNIRGAFWRGVAVGIGTSWLSAAGCYLVFCPGNIDLAILIALTFGSIVVFRDGGFA